MTSAKGRRDFLSKEWVVGTAFNVDRTYLGGQLASREGVTLVYISQLRIAREGIRHGLLHSGGELQVAEGSQVLQR
jgi:hypothetical protein